ncbi:hypothetical protein [Tropicimonas aquimaris]|uniref:Uncharacterized protein n=1 Tax=Tropicimonas aquimaris TaxID=914152 RepID=A0ABW3IN58_9RHOB
MTRVIKVFASDRSDLMAFLANSQTGFGPGSFVLPQRRGVATIVFADKWAVELLRSRRTQGRRLEFLDIFSDPRDCLEFDAESVSALFNT